jgi:hypothetical protein
VVSITLEVGLANAARAKSVGQEALASRRTISHNWHATFASCNHHLYGLLAYAEVVEADENRQCVKRIRVRGKRGPVDRDEHDRPAGDSAGPAQRDP